MNTSEMWYVNHSGNRLRYGDDREIKVGRTHGVSGSPRLCGWGLHASPTLRYAFSYGGSHFGDRIHYIYCVSVGGTVSNKGLLGDRQYDKVVGSERTYLFGGKVTPSVLLPLLYGGGGKNYELLLEAYVRLVYQDDVDYERVWDCIILCSRDARRGAMEVIYKELLNHYDCPNKELMKRVKEVRGD